MPVEVGKSYIPQKKAQKIYGQPCTSIQGFLLRYTTLSYVIWLRNGRLCKFDENIGIWLIKHYDLYLFWVGLHMHTVPQNIDKFTVNSLSYCCEALIFTHPLVYEFICGLIFMGHPVRREVWKVWIGHIVINCCFFVHLGLLTTSQGLKLAYASPNIDFEAVKSLEIRTQCDHGDFQGVDILLTSDWPLGIGSGDDQVQKTDGVSLISRLAVKLRPR